MNENIPDTANNPTITLTLDRQTARDILTAVDAHCRCIVGGARWQRLRSVEARLRDALAAPPPEKVAGQHTPGLGA